MARSIFHYYPFDTFKVDVFGYDEESETFDYSVETPYSSKVRQAKKQYKTPDKRNPWRNPGYSYINIITPQGKKRRLILE